MYKSYSYPIRLIVGTFITLALFSCGTTPSTSQQSNDTIIISVVGTNDIHGQLLGRPGSGGMKTFSGYVEALRAARTSSGGVVLIDAGDMWQGTLESNLSEGATMIDVFNQLKYTAAAVGNHEFDFGPQGSDATPQKASDDPQGALKARAIQAQFPLLAANLIDLNTEQPVSWPNVQPSILVSVADVKIGIIGVMTIDALGATIASNTAGLRVAPLAPSIAREARALRKQGADLVIVTAHAGGTCSNFDDPDDLSSCAPDEEIMQVARALPTNLVDHIIAGHQHRGIAHNVNGIAVTASFSSLRAFGRVDFYIDKKSREVIKHRIFAPQRNCPFTNLETQKCAWEKASDDQNIQVARYEDRAIKSDPLVAALVDRASQQAQKLKARPIGVYLETPITNRSRPESALGNLMTDALLHTTDADVSLHNIHGGIRADLPAGELRFGDVYQMFPFDNRAMILELTGAQLEKVIENQAYNTGKHAGFSGMQAFVNCQDNEVSVELVLDDGSRVGKTDVLNVAVNDFLVLGGDNVLTPVIPDGGFDTTGDWPLARDVIIEWFAKHGGKMNAEQFLDVDKKRWNLPNDLEKNCPRA